MALYGQMRDYGMRLVAISDHDTLAGHAELRAAGLGQRPSPQGPRLIAGLEINTVLDDSPTWGGMGRDGEELHILGYGIAIDDPDLAATLLRQREGRRARLLLTLDALRRAGSPVDAEIAALGLHDVESLGRPHVARALVAAGHAESVDDAFDRFLGHGRPCYVPRQGIGPLEAVTAIVAAGGIASLAHAPAAPDRAGAVDRLMDRGMTALEVYHRSFDARDVRRMAAFATDRGLLATGGSDYHGDTMDYAETQATTFVPATVGERLLEALAR
jgi:3',5'-nucleoside bisphosphate phosphatase